MEESEVVAGSSNITLQGGGMEGLCDNLVEREYFTEMGCIMCLDCFLSEREC